LQQKPDPTYTVLVVPEHGASVTRLRVTGLHVMLLSRLAGLGPERLRRLARIGGSVLFVLASAAVGMTLHYLSVVGRASDNTALREENLELKQQLAGLQEKTAHINEQLARVKHLAANLQNISRLNDPDRKLASAPGFEGEERDPRREPDPKEIAQNLSQLDAEAQSQENSLRALTGYFEDRQALLASAPSIWPVRGWVTSDFGFRLDPYTSDRTQHQGLDIANATGTPVVAPADGTVVFSNRESGYGNVLVLDHGNGIKTRYGHLNEFKVRAGDRVRRGTLVATVGNTGRATGPHLHYEVRVNGLPENPRKFILETGEPGDPHAGDLSVPAAAERGVGGPGN